MSWIVVGVGVGTAALAAYQQGEQAKAAKRNKQAELNANAAQIENAPYTHAAIQTEGMGNIKDPSSAAVGGAMQGGLTGAMMGSQFKKQLNQPQQTQPNPTYNGAQMAGGAGDQGTMDMNTWLQLQQQQKAYT